MFERGDFLLSPHCVWAECCYRRVQALSVYLTRDSLVVLHTDKIAEWLSMEC